MPDVSIAISAQDSYSSAIKSMAQITKSFSKELEVAVCRTRAWHRKAAPKGGGGVIHL